ncbi:MAG: hypothetical protein QOE08_1392 [Thermoleophilaceae bacterium]|jgi:hypothetical protein|nr:hypothetical protein [Thermoleophilaceae bacterium]
MKTRIGALTVLVIALACGPATAAPVKVNLRVEGATSTIFEGPVTTDGHAIEQDKAGPQKCDGTNGGANPAAGPTMTSALDDALAWDGSWSTSFSDFLINRIGTDAQTSTRFWGYALNYKDVQVGGCQQRVKAGDEVLFAFDAFGKRYLKLTGPTRLTVGQNFNLRVVDGKTGKAVAGAKVAGLRTNSKGIAKGNAKRAGRVVLKATASKSLRSNALVLRISRK